MESALDIINEINRATGKESYNTDCMHYCEYDNEPYCDIKMDMCFCTRNCAYFKPFKDEK